jgi:hypothetical protein
MKIFQRQVLPGRWPGCLRGRPTGYAGLTSTVLTVWPNASASDPHKNWKSQSKCVQGNRRWCGSGHSGT